MLPGLLACLLVLAGQGPTVTGEPKDAPGLRDRLLRQVTTTASKRWRVGIAVASCRTGALLFGYNAATALSPASNQKLLVTACAVSRWSDTLARRLDSLLDATPTRKHRRAANPVRADSLGINARPDFPGYRHLVLANRQSDNLEAEWMLKELCRRQGCQAQTLVSSFLDSRSVPHPGLRVWDGCGLARRNRVAPLTLAKLLQRVHASPSGELFRSTLAVPGRPGTLVRRNLGVGPRLCGKTGFIRDVFALSGYLAGASDTFAFSFILNGCGSGARAYSFFDGLLNALDAWDSGARAEHPPAPDSGSGRN